MKQVKGTMVVTIIKSIKANTNKKDEYDKIFQKKLKIFLIKEFLVHHGILMKDIENVLMLYALLK